MSFFLWCEVRDTSVRQMLLLLSPAFHQQMEFLTFCTPKTTLLSTKGVFLECNMRSISTLRSVAESFTKACGPGFKSLARSAQVFDSDSQRFHQFLV